MNCPKLVLGDGHLGIWGALTNVFPDAKEQRCWNHRIVNILDQVPKKLQAQARELLTRIPEKIGLVRRYVLDGVCRIGPCGSAELDALLGLGKDQIEQTLQDLVRHLPDLERRSGWYHAGPETRRLLAAGLFTRVVEQRRKFIVNGLTDRLLPVDFWRGHEDWRLQPDPDKPAGSFRTASGQPTEITIKIADRMGSGRDDLQRCLNEGNDESRRLFGVPAGACEQVMEPEVVQLHWVLSFLLVRPDAKVEIVSAHRRAVPLLDEWTARLDYLAQVCQGLRRGLLEGDEIDALVDRRRGRWPPETEVRPGRTPGEVLVRVANPAEHFRPGGEEREGPEGAGRRVSGALLRGRDWDNLSGRLLRLVPGDNDTAAHTGLLRAVHELRGVVRPLQIGRGKPPLDLAEWWKTWQNDYHGSLPPQAVPPPQPLEDLLALARDVPDTEFHDKLEWLSKR